MYKKTLLFVTLFSVITLNAQEKLTAGNTVGDTGLVTFMYQGKDATYKTVRAADGNEWLQQNLGSSQVATSIDDELSFGDYFQYGRWDDGHQLKDSETTDIYPTPNNPLGLGNGNSLFYVGGGTPWSANYEGWFANPMQNDDWSAKSLSEVTEHNGMDPCKAIGNDWEMPSETDWDNVMQKELIFPKPDNVTRGIDRGFNSNLKIAGAGSRKDLGWSFVGARAYIWTKTASKNPNFYRYVYLGAATSSTIGFGGDAKSFGYSVRCINKTASLNTNDLIKDTQKVEAALNQNELKIVSSVKIKYVKIFNLNGQIVLTSNQNLINISHLKPAVYLVSVETVNGKETNMKIMKK